MGNKREAKMPRNPTDPLCIRVHIHVLNITSKYKITMNIFCYRTSLKHLISIIKALKIIAFADCLRYI